MYGHKTYRELLTEEGGNYNGDPFFADFPRTDSISKDRLMVNLTYEEVMKAAFDMKPLKAPGPGGFQPCFYRSQWIVVGQDVFQFVRSVFNNEQDSSRINLLQLVLIPKVPKPDFLY